MSYHVEDEDTRSWLSQQVAAIVVTLVLTTFLFTAIVFTIFGEHIIHYIFDTLLNFNKKEILLINIARWLIITGFVYFSIAFIYYYGPKHQTKFFSPGASVATVTMILITIVFAFYIENFSSYNKLYGSIGTIMGIMLMIYLNSFTLLIGYELNAAINRGSTHIKLDDYK